MASVKNLEKPSLGVVKMKCDKVVDKKLLKYPMIKECFSKNHFTIIVGIMGQGKTSLATSLIKNVFNNCYENIYIIMPEDSRLDIEDDIFGKHLPQDQLYDDLTIENLEEIHDKMIENKKNNENTLLLIDDFQQKLKNNDIAKKLEEVVIRYRHLNTSVIFLQQNYNKCPQSIRIICSNLICFNLGKEQFEKIHDEMINMNKKDFFNILKVCFVNEHDWMCIRNRGKKQIYRMFDEVIY
jgi:hypothetical protein